MRLGLEGSGLFHAEGILRVEPKERGAADY